MGRERRKEIKGGNVSAAKGRKRRQREREREEEERGVGEQVEGN